MQTNCASFWIFFLVGAKTSWAGSSRNCARRKRTSTNGGRAAGLKRRLREAEKLPEAERRRNWNVLPDEERKLQEDAERFSRKLERLQAEEAGASGQSCRSMGQASDDGAAGEAGGAAEQAEAAQQDLEEAQRELAANGAASRKRFGRGAISAHRGCH